LYNRSFISRSGILSLLALAFAAFGGTSFRNANLTDANLSPYSPDVLFTTTVLFKTVLCGFNQIGSFLTNHNGRRVVGMNKAIGESVGGVGLGLALHCR
jgi:hypothetical protein